MKRSLKEAIAAAQAKLAATDGEITSLEQYFTVLSESERTNEATIAEFERRKLCVPPSNLNRRVGIHLQRAGNQRRLAQLKQRRQSDLSELQKLEGIWANIQRQNELKRQQQWLTANVNALNSKFHGHSSSPAKLGLVKNPATKQRSSKRRSA